MASYHREAVTSHLASPWRFRDGNEYLVSLSISDKPKWASISLQDKITAEEWSGQFDLKYIENLTQRTGNYKSFDTFVAMIKSAILKKSDAVTLDLMSYEDLLMLKSNKSRVGPTVSTDLNLGPNLTKFENPSDPEIYQQQRQGSGFPGSNNKQCNKYLIVTYVAEFDKVHYPLPLKYTGYPDATIMQQTIQKLKSEVSQLKQTNTDLIVQLQSALKVHSRHFPSSKVKTVDSTEMDTADDDHDNDGDDDNEDGETMTIRGKRPGRNVTKSTLSQDKFQSLAAMVKKLEFRIENERVDHKDQVNKLEAENDYLRNRLKAIEMSENALKDKVTRLESVLAMNVGLKRNSNHNNNFKANQLPVRDGSKEVTPKESYFLARTSSLTRTGRPKARGRPPFHPPPARNISNSSRCSSIGSERDPTAGIPINIELTNNNVRHGGSNSRQSSRERKLFNPTDYVKKKKIKQERMAQMRMAKVESRIRSNSQDRHHRQQSSGSIKRQETGKTDSAANLSKEIKELRGAPAVVRRNSSLESCTSERGNSNKSISYLHGRRASPSPSMRSSLTNIAFPEKRNTTVKSNIGPYSSFDMIRNNKKDGRPRKGAYEESRDRFRNAYKTDDKLMKGADSNMSFEKLQKRLHTIHAFLEVNKRRRN